MFTHHDYFRRELSLGLAPLIKETLSVSLTQEELGQKLYKLFTLPPSNQAGDLALPLFFLASLAKINPAQLARILETKITTLPSFISSHKAVGPYLNFFFNFKVVAKTLIPQILSGDYFKQTLTHDSPKTMIEYSQPNTHKELHVGHMRNLCLGDALVRLHRYCGIDIISSTFPGDVGTHVAKCLWFLKFHYQGEIPQENQGAWLGSLYSAAHNKLEQERATPQEAQNREKLTLILKQLEQKSGEFFELWKQTRQWSIDLMNKIYAWAGVHFDVWYWESEVDSASVKLARDYYERGLFVEDEGAIGVNLEEWKLGFCLLIKSDGNGLYATKDIELARRKFTDFNIERNIYVVDKRQERHFKQVFKVLELMGLENAKKCFHLQYDFVELPDGAMSSRKGNIVPLELLIQNMEKMIKEQYLIRYQDEWSEEEINQTAQIVAQGAIKFGMTRIDPAKKIVFDMKEWLRLDGESGPYIQYVCARIHSMLKKLGPPPEDGQDFIIDTPQEKELLAELMNFHHVIEQATLNYRPSVLTSHLYAVARAYNSFYAECPVASSTGAVRSSRLKLSASTGIILRQGLSLLGIEAPEKM